MLKHNHNPWRGKYNWDWMRRQDKERTRKREQVEMMAHIGQMMTAWSDAATLLGARPNAILDWLPKRMPGQDIRLEDIISGDPDVPQELSQHRDFYSAHYGELSSVRAAWSREFRDWKFSGDE